MPIVESAKILRELRSRYPGVEIRDYIFKRLYSTEHKVFFNCSSEPKKCLTDALTRVDYKRFVAYAVVENAPGSRYVVDVSYANL